VQKKALYHHIFTTEALQKGKEDRMSKKVELTLAFEREHWRRLKTLSGDLNDNTLVVLAFQSLEVLLEALKRGSRIVEVHKDTNIHEVLNFADLLYQYGLDDLCDDIKKAKPKDFS